MLKNEILNQKALNYNEGNQFALVELSEELGGFIRKQAKRSATKAEDMNVFIPAADFESAYTQALWQAAEGYDGSSEFMQRFRTFMKRREADVWRSYRTNKDGEATYEKARQEYLDKPVNDDGETLGDVVLSKYAANSPEDEIVGISALLETIEAFKHYNEKYYNIIKLLSKQATNEEIADALGEQTYNGKVRTCVFRARDAFKKFLLEKSYALV